MSQVAGFITKITTATYNHNKITFINNSMRNAGFYPYGGLSVIRENVVEPD
jgi:hypothetical protein